MADYHYRFAGIINDRFDLHEKSVLEIGSQTNFIIANELLKFGAKNVVCVDRISPENQVNTGNDRIQFLAADAAELPLQDKQFDVIVGVAVLEHFQNIRAVANELVRVLRPGGHAFLNGGGLWSSPLGHHLWVDHESEKFRFNGANNPIPQWGHLLHSPTTLNDYLVQECNVKVEAARKIVDMVYFSDVINRAYPSQILRDLQHVDWQIDSETYVVSAELEEYFKSELAHQLPPHDDYMTKGINCFISRQ